VKGFGWVQAFPAGGTPASTGAVHLPIPGGGEFELEGLDAGRTYDLIAGGFAGHRTARAYGMTPGTDSVELVLERAARITGRVLDEHGRPVPAGTPVRGEAIDPPTRDAPGATSFAYTLFDGAFALEGLGDFEYRVAAGGGTTKFAPATTLESVAAGATGVEVRVTTGSQLRGRLLDANGEPLKVKLLGAWPVEGIKYTTRTRVDSDDGAFVLSGLPAGRVSVYALVDGTYVGLGEHTVPAENVELRVPGPEEDASPK